jgi:hypothetical protein
MRSITKLLSVLAAASVVGCSSGSDPAAPRAPVAETYAVDVTVSGLAGTIRLQNRGADDLVLTTGGTARFATALQDGAAYDVTVADWPPTQACSVVAGGSGVVAHANVAVQARCESLNVVFVSSARYGGDLGGLAGADAKCAALASAAGLAGTFKAFLFASSGGAPGRLGAARGWVRPDGKPFADTVADLTAGRILHPPRIDETGADVGQDWAWSGSTDGTVTCDDWVTGANTMPGRGGATSGTAGLWVSYELPTCATPHRLYCFGVDHGIALPSRPRTGRLAFVATGAFSPSSGLAGADAVCQGAASAAALTGRTFKALLATPSASAASRFSTTGATWVRPDGTAIVATAADLATALLDAPINQDLAGTHHGNSGAWVGAASLGIAGTAASTCDGWSTATAGQTAQVGIVADTKIGSYALVGCSQAFPKVVCLEE